MAKIKSPLRFSRHFNLNPDDLLKDGVFDPVLGADTALFIDPLLIHHSSATKFAKSSSPRIETHFTDVYRLLASSKAKNDISWREVVKHMKFHEIPGTCLGYGGGSINGSGWGPKLIAMLLDRAKHIIDAGVNDPRLFLLIGLFSEKIGPDRISDMYTNILLPDIVEYTQNVCSKYRIPTQEIIVKKNSTDKQKFHLPKNPLQAGDTPILLVPFDVLRELPVALSIEDVWQAAAHNEDLRKGINKNISVIWEKTNRKQKAAALKSLLSDASYAGKLIDQLIKVNSEHYDQYSDPDGLLIWTDIAYSVADKFPKQIQSPTTKSLCELDRIVTEIIEQFQFLLEQRDLWRVLHESTSRQTEKTTQRLFYSVAYAYCKANNFDITPEADTGNGTIDFKFTNGANPKILVELKLSTNNIKHGHDIQLPTYVKAENADKSHYVVIDIGRLGRKWTDLQAERKDSGQIEPTIWLIDGTPRSSASKR